MKIDTTSLLAVLVTCLIPCSVFAQRTTVKPTDISSEQINIDRQRKSWKLIFADHFSSAGNFDVNKWDYAPRNNAAWTKFLTPSPDYVFQKRGKLILRMDDQSISADQIPYHSGGIQTSGKFNLKYGKIEVKAKFNTGKGSWPAIWMMPEKSEYGSWPGSGEIDIMEHVNSEKVVHQTIHNGLVTDGQGGSTATHKSLYKENKYNIYGIVWTAENISFYVNGIHQYTYDKVKGDDKKQWPFDQPFYLILNQSGGAGWPGKIIKEDLPFTMYVDWVRVYQPE